MFPKDFLPVILDSKISTNAENAIAMPDDRNNRYAAEYVDLEPI
jgi:hypothetical protein